MSIILHKPPGRAGIPQFTKPPTWFLLTTQESQQTEAKNAHLPWAATSGPGQLPACCVAWSQLLSGPQLTICETRELGDSLQGSFHPNLPQLRTTGICPSLPLTPTTLSYGSNEHCTPQLQTSDGVSLPGLTCKALHSFASTSPSASSPIPAIPPHRHHQQAAYT